MHINSTSTDHAVSLTARWLCFGFESRRVKCVGLSVSYGDKTRCNVAPVEDPTNRGQKLPYFSSRTIGFTTQGLFFGWGIIKSALG